MDDIAKKLHDRRIELGKTLEEVGQAVGVGRSTVRKWENGMIKNMGRDKIIALANALQLNPIDIVPGEPHITSIIRAQPTEEEYDLIYQWRKTDEGTKAVIRKILDMKGVGTK